MASTATGGHQRSSSNQPNTGQLPVDADSKTNWQHKPERGLFLLMKTAISRGLVLFAGLLAGSTAADPDERPADLVEQSDPRMLRVKQFFLDRDCPAHV